MFCGVFRTSVSALDLRARWPIWTLTWRRTSTASDPGSRYGVTVVDWQVHHLHHDSLCDESKETLVCFWARIWSRWRWSRTRSRTNKRWSVRWKDTGSRCWGDRRPSWCWVFPLLFLTCFNKVPPVAVTRRRGGRPTWPANCPWTTWTNSRSLTDRTTRWDRGGPLTTCLISSGLYVEGLISVLAAAHAPGFDLLQEDDQRRSGPDNQQHHREPDEHQQDDGPAGPAEWGDHHLPGWVRMMTVCYGEGTNTHSGAVVSSCALQYKGQKHAYWRLGVNSCCLSMWPCDELENCPGCNTAL